MKRPTRPRPSWAVHLWWVILTAAVVFFTVGQTVSDSQRVDLLFASTRQTTGDDDPSRFLGKEHGPLLYGRCTVRYGSSPRSGRWSGYGDLLLPGDDREVVAAETIEKSTFESRLEQATGTDRVVLFVHGYAYGFGRACRRVSDLQVVLGEGVTVVLFSWPSAGNPLVYGGDREALTRSLPSLVAAIEELSGRVGPQRLAIVAHSMGAHGVVEAVSGGSVRDTGILAGDLVLIAPDYGADTFRERFDEVSRRFGRVTLYTSSGDVLLKLSSLVNGDRRLGQGGEQALLLPGLETVDVSAVPRYHPAAHEYQYFNPHVVGDLVELLRHGRGANRRESTARRERNGKVYWILQAPVAEAGSR